METPKRKRGRPAMFTAEERALGDFVAGVGKFGPRTRRKQDNAIYQSLALATIAHDEAKRFAWLYSDTEKNMRTTILCELGRLNDPAAIERIALQLCELKPTTSAAVAMIRHARLGRQPQGTPAQLGEVLRKALNTYFTTHEGVTLQDAVEALEALTLAAKATIEATEAPL